MAYKLDWARHYGFHASGEKALHVAKGYKTGNKQVEAWCGVKESTEQVLWEGWVSAGYFRCLKCLEAKPSVSAKRDRQQFEAGWRACREAAALQDEKATEIDHIDDAELTALLWSARTHRLMEPPAAQPRDLT